MQSATRRFFWSIIVLLAIAGTASAQDGITISGVVTTRADGLPVPGAVVSVVGVNDAATTDASGRYTLQVPRSAVRAGGIQVKVEALGLPAKVMDVAVTGAAARRWTSR